MCLIKIANDANNVTTEMIRLVFLFCRNDFCNCCVRKAMHVTCSKRIYYIFRVMSHA